ncbi:unnamed protein product [Trichobilharzia szidati]|nr:unnamed protein product [Trichobilharzia szidati]
MDQIKTEATCLPAGRYEFKDSGLYIGEWLNEKAVGLGLITKDKCQGEYTGLWDSGSEKSGVFLWPNAPGAMYEGEWAQNRRNGYGIFTREDWVIMGRFKDDFITLGIKCKENSIGRFEGEFENGFPRFGVETYADGGSYAGEYKNGVREGLGVRQSIPYGEVINFFPEEAAIAAEMALDMKKKAALQSLLNSAHHSHGSHHQHHNQQQQHHNYQNDNPNTNSGTRRGSLISQRSGDAAELEDFDLSGQDDNEEEPYSGRRPNPSAGHASKDFKDLRMSCKFKCGFVLSSQRSELMLRRQQKLNHSGSGSSLARNKKEAGRRAKSLTNLFNRSLSKESIACVRRQGSVTERSARAVSKFQQTPESVFTLDQVDAIDPETVETFSGQWEADSRHGYGVCERSDGVVYEGQWVRNQRHGYGQTHFPDGACEQGRYQNGKLVFLSWPKGTKPHLFLYNYHIMREVANAVKRARNIAEDAQIKAKEARENLSKVENAVQLSKKAAELARDYSLETRELVKEMYPDFEQPGIKYLEDMVRLMKVTKRGNQAFDTALQAAKDVIAGVEANLADQAEQQNQQQQQQQQQSEENMRSSMNLDVLNSPKSKTPVSRAGSYRLKRRGKHKTANQKAGKDKSRHGGDGKNVEFSPGDETGGPLTLQVPQWGTNVPGNIDSSFHQTDNMNSVDNLLKKPHLHTFSSNGRYLSNEYEGDMDHNYDDDMSYECDSVDEETRTTRSSSEASNYVILPTIDMLKPPSELPVVPLNKLMSNTAVMDDHFGQYKITPKRSPTLNDEIQWPTERLIQPRNVNTLKSSMHSPDAFNTELLSGYDGKTSTYPHTDEMPETGRGLVRRRTLPGFSTQPPLDLSKCSNLPTLKENGIANDQDSYTYEYGELTSPVTSSKSWTSQRDDTTSEVNNVNVNVNYANYDQGNENLSNYPSINNQSIIYLVDNGIRKRAYAYPTEAYSSQQPSPSTPPQQLLSPSSSSTPPPSTSPTPPSCQTKTNSGIKTTSSPLSPSSSSSPYNRRTFTLPIPSNLSSIKDNSNRTDKDINTASLVSNSNHNNQGKSTPTGMTHQRLQSPQRCKQSSPLVVANVLLEDPQDTILELPTYFKESQVDLCQNMKRRSVPDVTKQSSTLSPSDLQKLSEEHKIKYEEILARKRQGEIIIQLVDFFDWCRVNISLLAFIVVNCLLAYFFYIIIYR